MVERSSGERAGRAEPTGAGCLLALACLLVVMAAEVVIVEVLMAHEDYIVSALAFMERHALHGQRGGWLGAALLGLNVAAIGAGLLLFKLGSLLLKFAGIAVWKTAADPANEVSGPC